MPTDRARKPVNKPPAGTKRNGSKPSASNGGRYRKRVKKLFSDIENLALLSSADSEEKNGKQAKSSPADVEVVMPPLLSEEAKVQHELETLRARVHELEEQLQHVGKSAPAPVLYEDEQLGFAYKGPPACTLPDR